jgi:hypothetical protein
MPAPPPEPTFMEPETLPSLHMPNLSSLSLDDLGLELPEEQTSNQHFASQVCTVRPPFPICLMH